MCVYANYALRSRTCLLIFKDHSRITVTRSFLFKLFFLAYSHGLFPVRADSNALVLNNGFRVGIETQDIFIELLRNRGWNVVNEYLEKDGIKYKRLGGFASIYDMYEQRVYDIGVQGRVVVDVGASIGDSPIYFAYMGAKKIIAYEPSPIRYKFALMNILLNPDLQQKIEMHNLGVCARDPTATVEIKEKIVEGRTVQVRARCTSLESIVKEVDDPYLLKIDCEGCEFPLVLNGYDYIRRFEKVIFEYHCNITKLPLSLLLGRLERDFICKVRGGRLIGIVVCTKKRKSQSI